MEARATSTRDSASGSMVSSNKRGNVMAYLTTTYRYNYGINRGTVTSHSYHLARSAVACHHWDSPTDENAPRLYLETESYGEDENYEGPTVVEEVREDY